MLKYDLKHDVLFLEHVPGFFSQYVSFSTWKFNLQSGYVIRSNEMRHLSLLFFFFFFCV